MKVWQSYGAEHSLNLVIIGKFRNVAEAEEFEDFFNSLTDYLRDQPDFELESDRYSSDLLEFLEKKNLYFLSPTQLGQLLYEMYLERKDEEIHISSNDDLNALISLLIHKGARVEAFSAHDYPNKEPQKP